MSNGHNFEISLASFQLGGQVSRRTQKLVLEDLIVIARSIETLDGVVYCFYSRAQPQSLCCQECELCIENNGARHQRWVVYANLLSLGTCDTRILHRFGNQEGRRNGDAGHEVARVLVALCELLP